MTELGPRLTKGQKANYTKKLHIVNKKTEQGPGRIYNAKPVASNGVACCHNGGPNCNLSCTLGGGDNMAFVSGRAKSSGEQRFLLEGCKKDKKAACSVFIAMARMERGETPFSPLFLFYRRKDSPYTLHRKTVSPIIE